MTLKDKITQVITMYMRRKVSTCVRVKYASSTKAHFNINFSFCPCVLAS